MVRINCFWMHKWYVLSFNATFCIRSSSCFGGQKIFTYTSFCFLTFASWGLQRSLISSMSDKSFQHNNQRRSEITSDIQPTRHRWRTNQYPDYLSCCLVQYKKGLIWGLFNRIECICKNEAINEEVKLLNKTLLGNGYLLKFINRWKSDNMVRPNTFLA